ncbi:MAG: hypothetical protein A3I44_01475 [Candidatus Sungbacteria bacterium RIFCSPLOWO2_02_FULL_51_17]|nr:MAG: hypothetical protein A3I44_01475 [Candidatus Sungbacteria bacterium RIFCSPLOWO2_02_FULL_51_17]
MGALMKDYGTCLVYNRVSLAGLILLILGGIATFMQSTLAPSPANTGARDILFHLSFLINLGSALLGFSGFGILTCLAYRRTLRHIDRFGHVDKLFSERLGKTYCCLRGMKLAMQKRGISR